MTARWGVHPGAAVVLAAGGLALGASSAVADAGLEHEWASDAVHLAWDGSTYAVATTSFLGLPVVVPGDRAVRTVKVTNGGPTTGVFEAWIVDVELVDGGNSQFFDDLAVDWVTTLETDAASMRELASAGQTRIDHAELGPGESAFLTVGYELPVSSTAGNRAHDGVLEASLDVLLRIEGADLGDPDDGEEPDGGEPPDGDGDDETPDGESPDGDDRDDDAHDDDAHDDPRDDGSAPEDELPRTGAELRALLSVVAGLLGSGVVLVLAARRRRRPQG